MVNEAFAAELRNLLQEGQFLVRASMAEHTTFRIGGPADYLIFPSDKEELGRIFDLLRKYDIPFLILGNGSNVLVRDKGIRGAVIKFGPSFSSIRLDGSRLVVGAGALLKDVASFAADCGLTGMEFAVGIPGSIGGAVFMNAGAYGGEMKHVIARVRSIAPDGALFEYESEDLSLGYRHSVFQFNGQAIYEVELALAPGDEDMIRERMEDFTGRRESKQPLEMPSAGSTFKRPEGHYAGTLIDQAGLKGLRVGDAMVSAKHAGFVVNVGHATARDVLQLIQEVKRRVYEAHGVELTPEVRIVGEE